MALYLASTGFLPVNHLPQQWKAAGKRVRFPASFPAHQASLQRSTRQRGSSIQVQALAGRKSRVVSAAATSTRIIIQGLGVEVTPAIKQHIEDKILKITAHFESAIKEVDVKLAVRHKDGANREKGLGLQTTEVVVYTLRHGVIRVADAEENLYASIDIVVDKLHRKLRKLKEKAMARGTWSGRSGPKGAPAIADVLPEDDIATSLPTDQVAKLPQDVVKTKVFFLEPLSLEEAVERLENVAHEFFVYRDKQSDDVHVLYKRKSNGYGVIITKNLQE